MNVARRAVGQPHVSCKEPAPPSYVIYGDPTRAGRLEACEAADRLAEDDPGAVVEVRIGTKACWKLLCQVTFDSETLART